MSSPYYQGPHSSRHRRRFRRQAEMRNRTWYQQDIVISALPLHIDQSWPCLREMLDRSACRDGELPCTRRASRGVGIRGPYPHSPAAARAKVAEKENAAEARYRIRSQARLFLQTPISRFLTCSGSPAAAASAKRCCHCSVPSRNPFVLSVLSAVHGGSSEYSVQVQLSYATKEQAEVNGVLMSRHCCIG